jgi:hypothetical protein
MRYPEMFHRETPDVDPTQQQMPEYLDSVGPEGEPDDWVPPEE